MKISFTSDCCDVCDVVHLTSCQPSPPHRIPPSSHCPASSHQDYMAGLSSPCARQGIDGPQFRLSGAMAGRSGILGPVRPQVSPGHRMLLWTLASSKAEAKRWRHGILHSARRGDPTTQRPDPTPLPRHHALMVPFIQITDHPDTGDPTTPELGIPAQSPSRPVN